jgi:gluconokinase
MSRQATPVRATSSSLVIIGPAASGKATLARVLADRLGWEFADADDRLPEDVRNGSRTRLTDGERRAWTSSVGGWLDGRRRTGRSAVIACSAITRSARDMLRQGRPGLAFVYLDVSPAELSERLALRDGRCVPATLLAQHLRDVDVLAADEPGVVVNGDLDPQELADVVLKRLGRTG